MLQLTDNDLKHMQYKRQSGFMMAMLFARYSKISIHPWLINLMPFPAFRNQSPSSIYVEVQIIRV